MISSKSIEPSQQHKHDEGVGTHAQENGTGVVVATEHPVLEILHRTRQPQKAARGASRAEGNLRGVCGRVREETPTTLVGRRVTGTAPAC